MTTFKLSESDVEVVVDFLEKEANPHLKDDSCLVRFDFNGQIMAVSVKNNMTKIVKNDRFFNAILRKLKFLNR